MKLIQSQKKAQKGNIEIPVNEAEASLGKEKQSIR